MSLLSTPGYVIVGLFVLIGPSSSSNSSLLLPAVDIARLTVPGPGKCHQDMVKLRLGLEARQLWAITMWDAGVKAPVGLLSQTQIQFGDYDECLTVTTPVTAQYCLVDVEVREALMSKLRWGLCLPASCTAQELETSLQTYMDTEAKGLRVSLNPKACTSLETGSGRMTSGDIIYCIALGGIILVIAAATICDVCISPHYDGATSPKTLVQCLSARYGWYSLIKLEESSGKFSFLHGLHFLSTCVIIVGHRFYNYYMFMAMTNYRDVEHIFLRSWTAPWTVNSGYINDLFFFMSSFLLSYRYLGLLDRGFVSPLKECFYRLRRLLPEYVAVIFFYATVLRHTGDGPLWNPVMEDEKTFCVDNWWTNLLFINNYVANNEMCMYQAWYVACDFQMFLVGTLLMLLIHRKPFLGFLATALVFLVATILTFKRTYAEDLPAVLVFDKEIITDIRHYVLTNSMLMKSHYRITSYIPGLLTGYVVYKYKNITLPKGWTYFFQGLALAIIHVLFFIGVPIHNEDAKPPRFWKAVFAATSRSIFGLGVGLGFLSFVWGPPTPLTRLFSWKRFGPLAKLSYGVYLVHAMVQITWGASRRSPNHLNALDWITWTVSDMVSSLVLAVFLKIILESPTMYLMKYFQSGVASSNGQEKKKKEI